MSKDQAASAQHDTLSRYPLSDAMRERLATNFTHHAPHGDQVDRYAHIRAALQHVAAMVCGLAPESDELENALTHLESAMMWANAAIARNEKEEGGDSA